MLDVAVTSSSLNGWRLAATSLMIYVPSPTFRPGSDNPNDVSRSKFLALGSRKSCHRRCSTNPINRHRFRVASVKTSLVLASSDGTHAEKIGRICYCLVSARLSDQALSGPQHRRRLRRPDQRERQLDDAAARSRASTSNSAKPRSSKIRGIVTDLDGALRPRFHLQVPRPVNVQRFRCCRIAAASPPPRSPTTIRSRPTAVIVR